MRRKLKEWRNRRGKEERRRGREERGGKEGKRGGEKVERGEGGRGVREGRRGGGEEGRKGGEEGQRGGEGSWGGRKYHIKVLWYTQPSNIPDSQVLSAPQEDGRWSGKHCTAAC